MNWDEFFTKKRIITLDDEEAIGCLKQLYEAKGGDAVLCALECFDPVGFVGKEIRLFWAQCNNDVEQVFNVIANVHGNNIDLFDFKKFTLEGTPFKNLLPLDKLSKNALKPIFPM